MCNSYYHSIDCRCGFGGEGHKGRRGAVYQEATYNSIKKKVFDRNLFTKTIFFKRTYSLTIPNAKCPVCGELVFFYQNEHGSKVFFDDLGIPWPKHPCTDRYEKIPDVNPTLNELEGLKYNEKDEIELQNVFSDKFQQFEDLQEKLERFSSKRNQEEELKKIERDDFLPFEYISRKKTNNGYIILGIYKDDLIQLFTESLLRIKRESDFIFIRKLNKNEYELSVIDKIDFRGALICSDIIGPDQKQDLYNVRTEVHQFYLTFGILINSFEYIQFRTEEHTFRVNKTDIKLSTYNKLKATGKGKITLRLLYKNEFVDSLIKAIDITA